MVPIVGAGHTAAIIANHPFVDGNKRTAFVVGVRQASSVSVFRASANLDNIGVALKEWIGLVAYYAIDRTDELFPGPDN